MSGSKVSITITNRAPGIQPPVYVAGSFSTPEWVPEPMEYTTNEDGVHTFTKTFQVEPESKIVYKFRVGEGDWWLLNEDAPTVTDDAGNRNNILEAPKATVPDESEEPVAEPAQTNHAKPNEHSTDHFPQDTDSSLETVQAQSLSHVEALKHSDEVDPARSSTPEIIKTITEVSESAALLDRSTPEPEVPETTADRIEEYSSTTLMSNAAGTAAEVADSAALLDHPTPEPEAEALGKSKEASSEVAAEVADTAATLDTEVVGEAPSEVAAQVADTAAKLDTVEPQTYSETTPPAYENLTDVKVDAKDGSLDITGFSNDQDPVPLFAHECAGLYEDDEIPGADEQGQSSSSGRPYEDDKEDYDDPTLERFPSTRDEIMSTVRKVETGLNADQVSVEGVPLSPVVLSRNSPTTEARNEPRTSETSPISRGQQHLPLPPSLTAMDEHSRSTTSLHSIAEDAEGAESGGELDIAEPRSEYIADVVEQSNGVDEPTKIANKTEADHTEELTANEIAPVVEQAETADEVIEVAQQAEGDQGKEIGVSDANLPAVVKVAPPAEDIASVVELPLTVQDIAPVAEQESGADGDTSTEFDTKKVHQAESKNIVSLNGEAQTEKETTEDLKATGIEASQSAHKPTLESLVTVPSPSVKPSTGLLSPSSDEDEAVVVKTAKSEEGTTKSGYLTPERAATPQPEEPGSPREPAPDTADPVAESELESSELKAEVEAPEPRSPQIVVSKPEETHTEEDFLPEATLGGYLDESGHADQDTEALEHGISPAVDASDDVKTTKNTESPPATEVPLDIKLSGNIETHPASTGLDAPSHVEAAHEVEIPENDNISQGLKFNEAHDESPRGNEASSSLETPVTLNGSRENTATTSATEENQASTLKQRSVARTDPTDRTNTPVSITDSHKDTAKGGNWFSAFLRLIFIDFFGGFVRKLYGGGRKTLVTTVVVLVAVGYASFRRTIGTEKQVVSY